MLRMRRTHSDTLTFAGLLSRCDMYEEPREKDDSDRLTFAELVSTLCTPIEPVTLFSEALRFAGLVSKHDGEVQPHSPPIPQ